MFKVKKCFDCKMFDVTNWVARLNIEEGLGGMPSHKALSRLSQGALDISSVVGQPPFWGRDHFRSPRVVAKSCIHDEGRNPLPQRPQYLNLYRRLKRMLRHSLRASHYKGSVVRQGKMATHKCPRVECGISGPSKVQGPVPKPTRFGCYAKLNSSSLYKQRRRNPLGRDVGSPVEYHDLVLSLQHGSKSQAHCRVPECDGRPTVQVKPSPVKRMVTVSAGV